MVITCSGCGKKYKFDEEKLQGRTSMKVRCPGCKEVIVVESPSSSAAEPVGGSSSAFAKEGGSPPTQRIKKGDFTIVAGEAGHVENLEMPEGLRITLAVLAGPDAGHIFQVEKPLVVLGRSDGDITLNDVEVSRRHARLEIQEKRVTLRDMESTNGTFVAGQKIKTAQLEHQSEFKIGNSTLMLILTEEDAT